MTAHAVDKELSWDPVTQAVAQTVVQHLPEATATEAYYYLVVQHLAQVLWRLGAGDQALGALNATLSNSVRETRRRINNASAVTREASPMSDRRGRTEDASQPVETL